MVNFQEIQNNVIKLFLSKEEADEFADSIRRAHKLIGNTNGTHVSVRKQCGTGL